MFVTIMKASDEQCGSHDMHSFLFRKEPEIYVANCVDGTSSNVLVTRCLEEYSQTSRKKTLNFLLNDQNYFTGNSCWVILVVAFRFLLQNVGMWWRPSHGTVNSGWLRGGGDTQTLPACIARSHPWHKYHLVKLSQDLIPPFVSIRQMK